MDNALIVGVNGFLGRALAKQLLQDGVRVVGLDINPSAADALDGLQYYQADISNYENLRKLMATLQFKQMVVFHMAGQANVLNSRLDPLRTFSINVSGTAHLLEACRQAGMRHVIFPSTALVYARGGNLPIQETNTVQTRSVYAATKLACEALLEGYAADYGFCCRIARLGNVYGPGGAADSVIGTILGQVRSGGPISINTLAPVRDFIYRDDVVLGLIALSTSMGEPGCEVFNLSSGIATSISEIAEIARLLGEKISITETEPASTDVEDRILLSVQRIKEQVHWQPKWSLEDGLRQTFFEMSSSK
jgi:UDP-glucose 4-epimerase